MWGLSKWSFFIVFFLLTITGYDIYLYRYIDLISQTDDMTTIRIYRAEPQRKIDEYLYIEEKKDDDGNILSRKTRNTSDGDLIIERFKYLTNGNTHEHYIENKRRIDLRKYEYVYKDNSGKLIKTIRTSADLVYTILYNYEDEDSYWESHYEHNTLVYRKHFDENGRLTEQYDYAAGGSAFYEYDHNGQLIYVETRLGAEDFSIIEEFDLTYNCNNLLTSKYEKNSGSITYFEYDDSGRPSKTRIFNKEGEEIQSLRYEYSNE